jgi:Tfp pilus assembly protein PilF/NAD-dependent SIR2 family protein deacetylase
MAGKIKSRSVEDLAESISHANGECVFLVGAGFSFSAGIPLAGQLVDEIKNTFPFAYKRAKSESYNEVMGELTPQQRAGLLTKYIDNSKVNWAHLALAQLFQTNKINRILTVNFDPLILKACSMVGEFPAVYDLATASEFKESRIPLKSVFYLNGQHTGFAMLNSEDELNKHKDRLNDIVRNTGTKRIWVVVGYSGDADPLADVLKDIAQSSGFDNGLYWVNHNESPSTKQANLLSSDNTFFIGKQDADEFMEELAQKLDCFPPVLLTDPFSHIETIITENIDFSTGGPYAEQLRNRLTDMIRAAEGASQNVAGTVARIPDLSQLLLAGKYGDIFTLWVAHGEHFSERQKDDVAWAYVLSGNDVAEEANEIAIGDVTAARIKWGEAYEKYAQALAIKPDMHEALNNWGNALSKEAQTLVSEDVSAARVKWGEAYDKYAQALSIKPDKHEALNNWGIALSKEAQTLVSEDVSAARVKWGEAYDKYAQALAIKQDMHEALNNWGFALNHEAQTLVSEDVSAARVKWGEAYDKYAQTLSIKPDKHEALNSWGIALSKEAQTLVSEDVSAARVKWGEAYDKYAQALAIKPDMHEALNNWGSALDDEAQILVNEDASAARAKWSEAYEKYAQALAIKPDKHETLNNWGYALVIEAQTLVNEDGLAARAKWKEAYEKYAQAQAIKPDTYAALNNWGNALLSEYNLIKVQEPEEALEILNKAGEILKKGVEINSGDCAYNYACYWALIGDQSQSIKWLEVANFHNQLPSKAHIDQDSDFDLIRDAEAFSELYQGIFGSSDL